MIKKILLLLILVMPFVVADTDMQVKMLETDINITVIGYYLGNESYINLSILTEDDTFIKNELSGVSNFKQSYEIDMIRKMNCSETEIYNLTKTCIGHFQTYSDWNNMISTLSNLNSSIELCKEQLNESREKSEYYPQYTECSASLKVKDEELVEIKKNQKDKDNEVYIWLIAGMVIGGGGIYFWKIRPYEKRPGSTPIEREFGTGNSSPINRPWQKDLDNYVRGK